MISSCVLGDNISGNLNVTRWVCECDGDKMSFVAYGAFNLKAYGTEIRGHFEYSNAHKQFIITDAHIWPTTVSKEMRGKIANEMRKHLAKSFKTSIRSGITQFLIKWSHDK